MAQTRRLIFTLCLVLIGFLPFHTLFTVWLATNFDRLYLWSAWKEILIAVITVLSFAVLLKEQKLRQQFLAKTYNKIALLYVGLCSIYVIIQGLNSTALVGFAIDARYVLIFLAAQVLGIQYVTQNKLAWRLLLIVSLMTALLALIQVLLLPPDFLTYFGYDRVGVNTPGIPPASHQVASSSELYRAQSTLRGPNALGAYLILPTILSAWLHFKQRKINFLVIAGLCSVALVLSYSRSALLGLLFGVGLCAIYLLKDIPTRFKYLGVVVVIIFGVFSVVLWENQRFQVVVLHNNPEVVGVQSNQGHLELSLQAVRDVSQKPLGNGLGQAGPTSALDDQSKAVISENYFLQVAAEIGWLGFVLLVALHVLVIRELWLRRKDSYVVPVLLVFCGLVLTNLLLHTWADEAVAITMWFFVGLVLYPSNKVLKSGHIKKESKV